MEVTRKNFKEVLPLVDASIKKSDFLVIDTEFTGIMNGQNVSVFDSPEEYYSKLLSGTTDFLLIQYGLCAFYWDEKLKHYMNDSYNFYLFPRGRPGPDKMFLCQSSSLDFLAAQGFDFNKLIREGISYMTEATETRLRDNLTERQKTYSNEKDIIVIPDENKQQIEEICKKVRDFLNDKNSEELEIDRCNAFIRRLLFQELGTRFKGEAFVETKVLENKNRVLKVSRITSENESQNRDSLKKEKEWEEFEDAVGFSKVARMISQSDKLVIGHNMLLDVLHTLNHFFQPLPPDYVSFKEFAHCMFPRLLDTKYMSSLPPFKDKVNSSVLTHLLATLSEAPFCMPKVGSEEDRGYTQSDEKNHEAGYDAYVTGLCFLAMHAHLSKMRGEGEARVTAPTCAALKPFLNKIFLAKTAYQDSPYMNLAGDDPTPSRDHVFHLTFPKEWQRNDINQLFSPFGPITVQFLDDTSAFIALARREQAKDAMKIVSKCARASLVPYNKYKYTVNKALRQQDKTWRREETTESLTPDSTVRIRRVSVTSTVSHTSRTPKQLTPKSSQSPKQTPTSKSSLVSKPLETPKSAEKHSSEEVVTTNRKRSSSGILQVDDAEPPPKKAELTRTYSDTVQNGRKSDSEKDSLKISKTATVFKESDSWD